MKIKVLLLMCCSAALFSFSQEVLHCGSDEMEQQLFINHPEYRSGFLHAKARLDQFTKAYVSNPVKSGAVYTIPVVFHIIHNNGSENISDAQIHDAIKQVNMQFRKQNSDTNLIVSQFKSIAADTEIEIRLAQLDPDGNCTSGITRTVSPLTYIGDHQVKSLIHWPPEKYLNVYVCADAAGLAGHALMPPAADTIPEWDGIVIRHDYVGSIGTSDSFKRTVLTHEIGHYLNLYHIWGGNNVPDFYYLPVGSAISCSYDDEVDDTPNTKGWSSCNLSSSSCDGTLDNVQNYMDYAYCALMFTEGQKLRMHAALNSPVAQRNNLWSPANLQATGTAGDTNYLCQVRFQLDRSIVCVGETVALSDISSHGVSSRFWQINGGTFVSSASDSTVQVIFNQEGTYDVALWVSNGTDTLNQLFEGVITVLPNVGVVSGKIESFEDDYTGISGRWIVRDVGQSYNWEVSNVGFGSLQSFFVNNFEGGARQVYEFHTEPMNLAGYNSLAIAFDWAYAQIINSDADLLQISISNDCGVTWQVKRTYSGLNSLKTVNQLWDTPFVPSTSSHWKSDVVTINGSTNFTNHTMVKFKFDSRGGNNFYLDNINIAKPEELGLHEMELKGFVLYPNPAGIRSKVTIEWGYAFSPQFVRLIDAQGRVVFEEKLHLDSVSWELSLQGIESGYYFVEVGNGEERYKRPLFVQE